MKNNPRLTRATRGMERRLFLKALALGLSLPLAARLARMATAAPAGPVKRFMVMYIPHGIAAEHYNPKMGADGVSFDLDQTNESILGPLQAYKQWVNVYDGLSYPNTEGTHEGIVNCLSGVNTVDETTPRITVEHVIAKGIAAKPLILGACSHQPFGIDLHGKLFWDGTTAIDPQKNPAKVADTLFGTGTPATPATSDAELRKKILELNQAEVADLQKSVTGLSNEQSKLTAFLAGLEAVRSGGGGAVSSCTGKPMLPTVEKVRAASAGLVVDSSGGNDYFYQESNFKLLLQAQLELSAQALICGAAPVIGLMPMYATCEFDFSFVGGTAMGGWGHHNGLSHTTPQATGQYNSPISVANAGPPAVRAAFAKAQRWFYQQLVDNLVSVLAKTPDPTAADGSMVLDNTLIFVMSEIGDGQNHNRVSCVLYPQIPAYLHTITIGKCAGAIKSGQVLSYPIDADVKKSGRPATDLYLSMAKAMGVASPTFPSTTGPIAEVLAT